MRIRQSKDVTLAKNILRGQAATLDELRELAERLKKEKAFEYARKILGRARTDPSLRDRPDLRLKLAQQQALCTYKDPELSAETKFDAALDTLGEADDLGTTKNQETLGIAGAIHKYKWEAYGQKHYLETALTYYFRGYHEGVESDYGYTGINAAFVFDLLANLESIEARGAGAASDVARLRREEAKRIREDLVSKLAVLVEDAGKKWLETEWWFLVTVAEACFGLRRYEEARLWLNKAAGLPNMPDWEKESTARQLALLARLQAGDSAAALGFEESEAWKVLCEFLGNNAAGVRTAFLGKIGVALSGGGFRASLFHIGVLARLAELDVLRHIEVLSCVSGGSIIGAHYYLEVRQLLQTKADGEITREDYIGMVRRIERDFLAGVQRNIRTRVAAEFLTNLKMIFRRSYSRTERAGELYEKELFSKVDDGRGKKPRWMDELLVEPQGEPPGFAPKLHNWRRAAKVPILVLNATALNTGHNWQFTATWMGEPPGSIDAEIDGNYRLRRMYYEEAPARFQKVRLGHAVAASACVPGIFEPIVFEDLYPGMTVRLVDGGVHDNQGIASLLEQGCTMVLASDASGQMEAQNEPSGGILGVPLRSNSILMARVREAQYRELEARWRSSLLRGLMFVHLKKDLDVDPVDWTDCQDPHEASEEARPVERRGPLTRYGIQKDIQKKLADIRTDLDSFSDAEAFALMTSGYRMTEFEFARSIEGFASPAGNPPQWDFLTLECAMKRQQCCEAAYRELLRLLDVAHLSAFKIWRLSPVLQAVAWLLGLAAFFALLWACWNWASLPLLTPGMVGLAIVAMIASLFVGKKIMRIVRFRETLIRIGIGIGMSLLGFLAARIHLHVFDRWYLRRGRINRLGLPAGSQSLN